MSTYACESFQFTHQNVKPTWASFCHFKQPSRACSLEKVHVSTSVSAPKSRLQETVTMTHYHSFLCHLFQTTITVNNIERYFV